MQESSSFWTEIKTLEEQLTKSPGSFCFARLAEIHLKVGLIDDALHVARQGVLKHPGYLSGQRVLSKACYAKGLNSEALDALKIVVAAMPEDVESQKLFGHLLSEAGDQEAACQAFRIALEFAPDDVQCRIELESIERSAGFNKPELESDEDDEAIIEDLEILEEIEIFEDEDEIENESFGELLKSPLDETVTPPETVHDPLSTVTLAELYVSQGFVHKALEIFRKILADNPADQAIAARIASLEALETVPVADDPEIDHLFDEEVEDGAVYYGAEENLSQKTLPDPEPIFEEEPFNVPVFDVSPEAEASSFVTETEPPFAVETESVPVFDFSSEVQTASLVTESEPVFAVVPEKTAEPVFTTAPEVEKTPVLIPKQGIADNALCTLEEWLENIRRMKLCR